MLYDRHRYTPFAFDFVARSAAYVRLERMVDKFLREVAPPSFRRAELSGWKLFLFVI
jgi:hypothetical protein